MFISLGGDTLINILNPLRQTLAILEDYFNDEIKEQVNESYTLNFSALLGDEKGQYIAVGNIVEVENQYFNIVKHRRTRSESNEVAIAVECEQVSYNLLFHLFEGGFINTGYPYELMRRALEGTKFSYGTVEPGGYISIDLKEGVNARGVLMEIAAQTRCELYFDKYTVSLLARRGQDRGVQKNLKGIVKDVNGQSGEVKNTQLLFVITYYL